MQKCGLLIAVLLLAGCTQSGPTGTVFTVTGFNAATHQYTLDMVNNTNRTHVSYTIECDYYQWGPRQPVRGKGACGIQVGDRISPDLFNSKPSKYTDTQASIGDGPSGKVFVYRHKLKSEKGWVTEQFAILDAHSLKYTSTAN